MQAAYSPFDHLPLRFWRRIRGTGEDVLLGKKKKKNASRGGGAGGRTVRRVPRCTQGEEQVPISHSTYCCPCCFVRTTTDDDATYVRCYMTSWKGEIVLHEVLIFLKNDFFLFGKESRVAKGPKAILLSISPCASDRQKGASTCCTKPTGSCLHGKTPFKRIRVRTCQSLGACRRTACMGGTKTNFVGVGSSESLTFGTGGWATKEEYMARNAFFVLRNVRGKGGFSVRGCSVQKKKSQPDQHAIGSCEWCSVVHLKKNNS